MANTMKIVLFLGVIIQTSNGYSVGGMDHSGSCTYNFNVWTPEKDVIHRLDLLETRCDNISASLMKDLLEAKNQLLAQIYISENYTIGLEKRLLKQQLDDGKQDMAVKDMKLECRGEISKLWAFLNQMQSSLLKGALGQNPSLPLATTVSDQHAIGNSEITRVVNQLKNGVGDLKAEWLLIKRQVQDIKSDSTHLKGNLHGVEEDTMTLKSSLAAMRVEVKKVRDEQGKLNHSLEKLKVTMTTETRNDDYGAHDLPPYDDELWDGIEDMKQKYTELTAEMATLTANFTSLQQNLPATLQTTTAEPTTENSYNKIYPKPGIPVLPIPVKETRLYPTDCQDLYLQGFKTSGVYQIKPTNASYADNVYCEMVNETGWTVLQRREDGKISFNKMWVEYKFGFGSLYGEFWIGNERMHLLTSQRKYALRIDMWDWEGHKQYAEYDSFHIGSEDTHYTLRVQGYHGNAGDSLSYHDTMSFSTHDKDNDLDIRSCASVYKSGWWFNSCRSSNLNGIYHIGRQQLGSVRDGIIWYTLKENDLYSLKKVEMKIRPSY